MLKNKFVWAMYGFVIFLGAFLMFLIQPLIGKIVTPQYGGVSQVWCLCLLFFQLTLLGGYTFTYIISKLSLKVQSIIYIIVMGFSVFFANIPLGEIWAPNMPDSPIISLLYKLLIYVALPAVLLSTVSTIMQNWFCITSKKNPYHFYSISNIGSFIALLSYPILIEPNMSVSNTINLWTLGYKVLVAGTCLISVLILHNINKNKEIYRLNTEEETENYFPPSITSILAWIILSTMGTVLLISFTNHITHDLAPVPLLWIIPLAIYLLTFVLCFSNKTIYNRSIFFLTCHPLVLALFLSLNFLPIVLTIFLNLIMLFCFCMVCNGEIYRLKPQPQYLPVFYLTIAFGGAIGGILVNLVAPVVFNTYLEFPLIIITMAIFTSPLVCNYDLPIFKYKIGTLFSIIAVIISLCGLLDPFIIRNKVILSERNFYGTAKVYFDKKANQIKLVNGTTVHGAQFINPKNKQPINKPTLYFAENTAIGISNRIARIRNNNKPLKIGIIGLGAGTIASYGQKGDQITYYEIDPKVRDIANNQFKFLRETKAKVNIIIGDGRLSLEKQPDQNYDILVIDAFSSDSIPVHLLTEEAVKIYLNHIKNDGLIIFHISNKYLDLNRVISNVALNLGLNEAKISTHFKSKKGYEYIYTYSVLSRKSWLFNQLKGSEFHNYYPNVEYITAKQYPKVGIWSDDYTNIFSAIQWN